MYTNRQYTTCVHDGAARYDEGPVPAEEFAGAGVLRDLSNAEASEMPLILARYAALRAWILRSHGERGAVATHALTAAREHLLATADEWAERELLGAALDAGRSARALELLDDAAHAAAARGHHEGARAIRETVHRARWWQGGFPPPSRS